jgi:rod shape-determining protein MreC
MAIYSAGRRRTMIILLLSSVLLITLDLRGNAVFNAARSGFEYALRPFEIAGDVITRPVSRMWHGMTDIDELEQENQRLQEQLDAQRSDQIAAQNALIENRDLRALLDLESLAAFDRVTASIIGSSPSNFDQRVEIDRGSLDGIRVGMPVINSAGLVGKITNVFPETAIVMLATDPQYHVPVKVVAEVRATPTTSVPDTVPSGLAVSDVTTTTSTTSTSTTSTSTTTTSTTIPQPVFDADGNPIDPNLLGPPGVTTTSTSTTTTTAVEMVEVTRETGELNGFGADRLPRVRFIADSPQFGRVAEGDAVLTAGGSLSLAPPDIPVGKVANVIQRAGTAGLELEVELNADLNRLIFLTVILYVPPTEAPALR